MITLNPLDIVTHLNELHPIDLSITMFAFTIVDLWTALSLSVKKHSFLSKTLIRGFLQNLILILLPYVLAYIESFTPAENNGFDYIQFISVFVTFIYLCAVSGSIISNYSAAYPVGQNFITKFAYKYFESEIVEKQRKHGIDHEDSNTKDGNDLR